jgi:hypothetical protein
MQRLHPINVDASSGLTESGWAAASPAVGSDDRVQPLPPASAALLEAAAQKIEGPLKATADLYNEHTFQPNTRRDKESQSHPDMGVPPYDRRKDEGNFAVVWLTGDGVVFSSRCRDFGQALRISRQHKRDPTWVICGLEKNLDVAQLCLSYAGQDWLTATQLDAQVRRCITVVATQNLPSPSHFVQPRKKAV